MNAVNPKSIRQLIITGIMAGKPTKEIAEAVQAAHPESAAAKKSAKHIGWYKADLKKRGLLPAKTEATAPETPAIETVAPVITAETEAPKQKRL